MNRPFFMGLFFMVSGYLMVMSYDRAGPGAFLRSRLLRLGVPLVFLLSHWIRRPAVVRIIR